MTRHANTLGGLLVALLTVTTPATAQTWPPRVQEIVDQLAAGVAHSAPDEERRAVTQRIAEQARFELGPNWGTKRADPGRPLSTDVIAMRLRLAVRIAVRLRGSRVGIARSGLKPMECTGSTPSMPDVERTGAAVCVLGRHPSERTTSVMSSASTGDVVTIRTRPLGA